MKNFLIVFCLGLVAGCGSGVATTYQVSGIVTLDGKPVEGAAVSFVPHTPTEDTDAAAGSTNAEGKYVLTTFVAGDGARDGQYDIRISKYVNKDGSAVVETKEPEPGAVPEKFEGYGKANPMTSAPLPKNILPNKYENQTTSGFSFTVDKKANTFNIELKSK